MNFLEKRNPDFYQQCLDNVDELNHLLEPVFGKKPFILTENSFGFKQIQDHYITHQFEGQLDTGKMMHALIQKCLDLKIPILNGVEVRDIMEIGTGATIATSDFEFNSRKVFVATNGFAAKLLKSEPIQPARAQVLVTEPIKI